MARKLTVQIVGDASSLDRAFKRSTKSANNFGRSIEKSAVKTRNVFLGASAGLLSAAGLVAALKSSLSVASDLEQQVSKTNVVFGESAKNVEDWSKTLVKSFGLSQRAALTTASGFGALFAPIGLTGEAAAEQSKQLTELGADLASFYNTDVQSALDALRSGLVGESEPLRKYGVLLTETRVATEAMAQSGKTNAKELTAQEKVLARVALIYKDSAQAQGDFARTSDTAANQIKIFQANMEDLQAALGQKLIPVLTEVITWLNKQGPALREAWDKWRLFFIGLERGAKRTFLKVIEPFSHLPHHAGEWARELKADVRFKIDALDRASAEIRAHQPAGILGPIEAGDVGRRGKALATAAAAQLQQVAATLRRAREAARQEAQARAAFAVERAEATTGLADDLAALNKYNALLARRIRGGHATLELEREQFQVQQQIADVLKQQAEARAEQRETRQFRALGLGPGGADLVPSAEVLRKQLGSAEKALQGTFLDTKKTRSLVARIRKVLSGAMGAISEDVRSTIQRLIDDLKQMQQKSRVDVTRFQATARGQLTLAGARPGGGLVITGGVHLHGVQNVQEMENALAKRRKQRARQRRSTR